MRALLEGDWCDGDSAAVPARLLRRSVCVWKGKLEKEEENLVAGKRTLI